MKLIRSQVAMAVCTALGSTAAMAEVGVNNYAAATKVYIGGATATDNVLLDGMISLVGGLCDSTLPINIYRAGAGPSQRVVVCTTAAGTPGADAVEIAVHKESNGGSSNGVVPIKAFVSTGIHTLQWLNVGALENPSCTSANVGISTNLAAYVDHTNCSLATIGNAGGANPHGGISDVEPALSFPAVNDADLYMSTTGVLDIVFGVPVTKSLYKALQVAQFGDTACDTNPAVSAYTISDSDPACVPSLSRAQVAGLYSGAFTSWNNIRNSDADGTGATLRLTDGVTPPTNSGVKICRRVSSSGTQAGAETYFLNQRCISGGPSFKTPDDGSTATDTTYNPGAGFATTSVNAGPGSGNVRACLNNADSQNFWAIGVLSTEVSDSDISANKFRMVAIDGYAPTLENVANGNYTYFTSNVMTKRNLLSGVEGAVMDILPSILSTPSVIANLNLSYDARPWGAGGILAKQGSPVGANTAPYSATEMATNPVNTLSRGGNNCAPAFAVGNTPTL